MCTFSALSQSVQIINMDWVVSHRRDSAVSSVRLPCLTGENPWDILTWGGRCIYVKAEMYIREDEDVYTWRRRCIYIKVVTSFRGGRDGFRMDLIIFFQKSTASTDSGLYFFCWNLFPERGESVDSGDFWKKVFFNQTRPGVLLCPTHAQHEDPIRLLPRRSGLRVPSRILRGCSLNNARSDFFKRVQVLQVMP